MPNTDAVDQEQSSPIEQMRAALQPKGTAPLVRLSLSSVAFYERAFVDQCIDDLERKTAAAAAGLHEFSPLERLAVQVLAHSAGLDIGHDPRG